MNGNTALKREDKTEAWDEVMKRAKENGFIRFAYGGFAMLSIDEGVMKVKAKKEEDKDKERVTPDSYHSLYGEEPGAGM